MRLNAQESCPLRFGGARPIRDGELHVASDTCEVTRLQTRSLEFAVCREGEDEERDDEQNGVEQPGAARGRRRGTRGRRGRRSAP